MGGASKAFAGADMSVRVPNTRAGKSGTSQLEEVGRSFNVTRERIRQIEAAAMRKLRDPSRADQLETLLDGEVSF